MSDNYDEFIFDYIRRKDVERQAQGNYTAHEQAMRDWDAQEVLRPGQTYTLNTISNPLRPDKPDPNFFTNLDMSMAGAGVSQRGGYGGFGGGGSYGAAIAGGKGGQSPTDLITSIGQGIHRLEQGGDPNQAQAFKAEYQTILPALSHPAAAHNPQLQRRVAQLNMGVAGAAALLGEAPTVTEEARTDELINAMDSDLGRLAAQPNRMPPILTRNVEHFTRLSAGIEDAILKGDHESVPKLRAEKGRLAEQWSAVNKTLTGQDPGTWVAMDELREQQIGQDGQPGFNPGQIRPKGNQWVVPVDSTHNLEWDSKLNSHKLMAVPDKTATEAMKIADTYAQRLELEYFGRKGTTAPEVSEKELATLRAGWVQAGNAYAGSLGQGGRRAADPSNPDISVGAQQAGAQAQRTSQIADANKQLEQPRAALQQQQKQWDAKHAQMTQQLTELTMEGQMKKQEMDGFTHRMDVAKATGNQKNYWDAVVAGGWETVPALKTLIEKSTPIYASSGFDKSRDIENAKMFSVIIDRGVKKLKVPVDEGEYILLPVAPAYQARRTRAKAIVPPPQPFLPVGAFGIGVGG